MSTSKRELPVFGLTTEELIKEIKEEWAKLDDNEKRKRFEEEFNQTIKRSAT